MMVSDAHDTPELRAALDSLEEWQRRQYSHVARKAARAVTEMAFSHACPACQNGSGGLCKLCCDEINAMGDHPPTDHPHDRGAEGFCPKCEAELEFDNGAITCTRCNYGYDTEEQFTQ